MPSLNHVSMWSDSDNDWIPKSPEEAALLCPYKVPAKNGLFRCELCKKFVTFTGGEKNVRHFRHAADEDKECEERVRLFSSPSLKSKDIINRVGLPIRIIVDEMRSTFRFEIGFHCIPTEVLNEVSNRQVVINGAFERPFVYSFDRLKAETLTYLSVGSEPSNKYSIKADKALNQYWPEEVAAVCNSGSLFDARTGHLKRSKTIILTGNRYYILTKQSFLDNLSLESVQLTKMFRKVTSNGQWYLYSIRPEKMSHAAYKFFMDNYGCELSEKPARLLPLWPVTTRTSYSVKTNRNTLLFYITGSNPGFHAPETKHEEPKKISKHSILAKIEPDRFPQLVSSGRTSIINYLYVWKDPLLRVQTTSRMDIQDGNGNLFQPGSHNVLPAQKKLFVTGSFDGMIIIRKNGIVIEKKSLKASERVPIIDVAFGYDIQITQGLDCVWSATFQRAKAIGNADDELYETLCRFTGKEVKITHKDGALIARLGDCPKVKQWLYDKIRIGHAPNEALKHLKKYISEQHNG